MKFLRFLPAFLVSGALLSACNKGDSIGDDEIPEPGETKLLTVDITYLSGQIPGSTSFATWPVAIFPEDKNAQSYKVRLHSFDGSFSSLPNDRTYQWEAGELPPTPYNVYPDLLDIKDGKYHMAIGRTWCSGCSAPSPDWIQNYKKGFGAKAKAEITYQY